MVYHVMNSQAEKYWVVCCWVCDTDLNISKISTPINLFLWTFFFVFMFFVEFSDVFVVEDKHPSTHNPCAHTFSSRHLNFPLMIIKSCNVDEIFFSLKKENQYLRVYFTAKMLQVGYDAFWVSKKQKNGAFDHVFIRVCTWKSGKRSEKNKLKSRLSCVSFSLFSCFS